MPAIPDAHHFARHCPKHRFQEDKASPEAFALRPGRWHRDVWLEPDTYLSGCWMEYHDCDIERICNDIHLTKKPGDVLLILGVGDIRQANVSGRQIQLDVKPEPEDPCDPDSHAGIHGYTLDDNGPVGLVLRRLVKCAKRVPV